VRTRLHLAGAEDAQRLTGLIAAAEGETGRLRDPARRAAALAPLLEGSPHGAGYLIGPRAAPVGFLLLSFGWSVARGGMEARLESLWIRPAIRGRGMGGEALSALLAALRAAPIVTLAAAPPTDPRARAFLIRQGFAPDPAAELLLRPLARP